MLAHDDAMTARASRHFRASRGVMTVNPRDFWSALETGSGRVAGPFRSLIVSVRSSPDPWRVALAVASITLILALFALGVAYAMRQSIGQKGGSKNRDILKQLLETSAGDRSRLFTNCNHSWCEPAARGAGGALSECGVCNEALEPEADRFQACRVCSLTVHAKCAASTNKNCKCVSLRANRTPPAPGALPRSPSETFQGAPASEDVVLWRRIEHHWFEILENASEEALDANSRCEFCKQPCEKSFMTPQILFGCLWCQHVAHAECLTANLKQMQKKPGRGPWCTFGQSRKMILPPSYVREIAPPRVSSHDLASTSSPSKFPSSPLKKAVERAKESIGKRARRRHLRSASQDDLRSVYNADGELKELEGRVDTRPLRDRYELLPLPPDSSPLLVFVNLRSGPQEGEILLNQLRKVLNPLQVWELPGQAGCGPEEAIELFRNFSGLRIGVCGGDGSVSWVLSALDNLRAKYGIDGVPQAPIAVLPLGTGNDLARTLNWANASGFGLESSKIGRMQEFLRDCERASVALVDRWTTKIVCKDTPTLVEERATINYFSIGVDAKVSLGFHNLREEHPGWFQNQFGNKLCYVGVGAPETLLRSCSVLMRQLRLWCDGVEIELPADLEGILVLNINSYMGGVMMWQTREGEEQGKWGEQAFNDGLLEVVGVSGTWDLAKLQLGVAKGARRLAQCSTIKVTTGMEVPMQADGEPWMQPPGTVSISFRDQVVLLRKTDSAAEGAIMEALHDVLTTCSSRGQLTGEQTKLIVTELARRLHH